jgi:hypothetical protein
VVKLYLDEDVNILLAKLLKAKNILNETTQESGMLGKSDLEQMEYAIKNDAAMVTHNRVHFEKIYADYISRQKDHSGIIILIRREVYIMASRLARFVLSHQDIKNQL